MVTVVETWGRTFRVLLMALMMIAPAVLSALAYASPPDPSWIRGMYDEADYDDVVVQVAEASGIWPVALVDAAWILLSREGTPSLVDTVPLVFARSSTDPRAPPGS